jgi:hypothetical protein
MWGSRTIRPNGGELIERTSDGAGNLSYPDYLDLRDRNRSLDALTAYNIDAVGLDTGENTSRVWIYEVSGNYFGALGIQRNERCRLIP